MNAKRIVTLDFVGKSPDLALLVLRVGFGLSLFLKHGLEKLTGYSTMVTHFPDPIGIGPHLSLAYALLSDGICSLLVVVGLATRWAAAIVFWNLVVVFVLVDHMNFFGEEHVEVIALYMVGYLALLIGGAGAISLDRAIRGSGK